MFKKARTLISFIDLLACALGASILLMLVFAKSKEDAANALSVGSPKDFIYCEIELQQPDAYLILQIRPEGGKWRTLELKKNAQFQYSNGFINLSNNALNEIDSYYAWGPFYKKVGNSYRSDRSYFGIYGVDAKDQSNWEFSASYVSHKKLDWSSNSETPDKIVAANAVQGINLVYRLRNKNAVQVAEKKIALRLGETQLFKINIQ